MSRRLVTAEQDGTAVQPASLEARFDSYVARQDTGWRDVTAFMGADPIPSGPFMLLRRINDLVYCITDPGNQYDYSAAQGNDVPDGFAPAAYNALYPTATDDGTPSGFVMIQSGTFYTKSLDYTDGPASGFVNGSGSWVTADAWPTSLPGTAYTFA